VRRPGTEDVSDTPGIADQPRRNHLGTQLYVRSPGALAEYANIAYTCRDLARHDQQLIKFYKFGH
jgi:hypothetical protein